ncbi:MAG: HAD family phosphatase [Ruminococcaceae bacterium]|nr:HAD family phosphatase [Oscillospiraceae bacterium]
MKNMQTSPKAYIFDMDGTLIDSVYALDQSTRAFLDPLGIEYPDNIVEIVTPLGYAGAAEYIQSLGVNIPVDEITTLMKEGMLKEYVESIPAKPFATELLQKLKKEGHRLCILSASPHFLIDPCVKRLDIEKYFDFIWSTDDFALKKSDEKIYTEAAKLLGFVEGNCIFVDDNLTNIKTAKAAGLKTVAVYDLASASSADELKKVADRYIYTFDEF